MQLTNSNLLNIKNFIDYIDHLNYPNQPSLKKSKTDSKKAMEICTKLPIEIQAKILGYLNNIQDYLIFTSSIKNYKVIELNANTFLSKHKTFFSQLGFSSKKITAEDKYLGYLFDRAIQKATTEQKKQVIALKRNLDPQALVYKHNIRIMIEKNKEKAADDFLLTVASLIGLLAYECFIVSFLFKNIKSEAENNSSIINTQSPFLNLGLTLSGLAGLMLFTFKKSLLIQNFRYKKNSETWHFNNEIKKARQLWIDYTNVNRLNNNQIVIKVIPNNAFLDEKENKKLL